MKYTLHLKTFCYKSDQKCQSIFFMTFYRVQGDKKAYKIGPSFMHLQKIGTNWAEWFHSIGTSFSKVVEGLGIL